MEAINDRFELQLDSKNYSLPRVKGGFKGERIPMSMIYSFVVRKLIGNTPGEHRPVLSPNSQLVAGGIIDSSAYSNGGGGGEEDGFDERSSISSTGEGAGKTKRRSSVLGTMFSKGNKNAITEEMIQDRPELCVDWQDVIVLKNYSCEHADILIGWQVAVYKKPNTSPGNVYAFRLLMDYYLCVFCHCRNICDHGDEKINITKNCLLFIPSTESRFLDRIKKICG